MNSIITQTHQVRMEPAPPTDLPGKLPAELKYIQYEHALEAQYLPAIRALISKDLSEPYSIYVYRYFLYQWGHLCYMVSTLRPHQRLDLPLFRV